MPQFGALLQPGRIGQMNLRNRIVMPAMGTNYAGVDGSVTDRIKDYYETRARGGAGLIIIEVTCIDYPSGKTLFRQLSVDSDRFIPGLGELAQVIQKHGAKAVLQLHHAGAQTKLSLAMSQPVAPSAIATRDGTLARELTVSQIERLVTRFAEAASRARQAGFDAVEIHGTSGYLVHQFLSRATNLRRDAYGGSLENRARFMLEILRAVRERVGRSYPVWCRIIAKEYGRDGVTLEEAQQVAGMLQDSGADAIHVTAWPQSIRRFPLMSEPPGNIVHLAEAIKSAVRIPVIAVGRMNPEIGNRIISEGKSDFVAFGKALIADPELPNKLATGRQDTITPCVGCYTCLDTLRGIGTGNEDGYVRCMANPAAGREREYGIHPAFRPRRILVIGGGPAGMEAAILSHLRGHQVTLCEKEQRLGGRMALAAVPPHKEGIQTLMDYLVARVQKLDIKVEVGSEATLDRVEAFKPDVVIVASGSKSHVPRIPGIDGNDVFSAEDVLRGGIEVGDRVVIVGGGQVGCETAEFLAEKGRKVTIVEKMAMMMAGVMPYARDLLLDRLAAKGVAMQTGVNCEGIDQAGLHVATGDGERKTIEADTIVLAAGAQPERDLFQELQSKPHEVYLIGDCIEPHGILEALDDAARVSAVI